MLVLTRKRDEAVDIYHEGRLLGSIMVVNCNGPSVRLGFELLPEIEVVRSELARHETERSGVA